MVTENSMPGINRLLKIAASAVVLAFLSGCYSDLGCYIHSQGIYKYDEHPGELTRSFELPEAREAIAPLGRSNLLGRWRCPQFKTLRTQTTIQNDELIFIRRDMEEVDEYEFRDDGTFAHWYVGQDNDQSLPHTETGGKWKYDEGVLSLLKYDNDFSNRLREYLNILTGWSQPGWSRPGVEQEPFKNAKWVDYDENAKWVDYDVVWHSSGEFTLHYRDLADVSTFWKGKIVFEEYDKEGCLRITYAKNGSILEEINSPMRFKRQ